MYGGNFEFKFLIGGEVGGVTAGKAIAKMPGFGMVSSYWWSMARSQAGQDSSTR